MITMVALELHLPQDGNWFSPRSSLNPKFFAYGSFPIYLLKFAGTLSGSFFPQFASYDSINLVGRFLSALFDLGTIFILYLLGKKLLNPTVGLLAAFFYTVSVLPIQLAHFFAVDTPLTFFIILTLYKLINFLKKPALPDILQIGIFFGLALATKTSALVLAVPIALALPLADWNRKFPKNLAEILAALSLLIISISLTFVIFEPFALLDFPNFWQQILQQQQMTRDAFTFPYTLQYVGKIPYFYELKNIFLWGLGPLLATAAFAGTLFAVYRCFRPILTPPRRGEYSKFIILNSFFWVYFLITGKFAIGFMRYMLPLYPLFCLSAAILVEQLLQFLQTRFSKFKFLTLNTKYLILIPALAWPLSFISIYSQPNTRTIASEWILQNISPGTPIAIEHWDDPLPVGKLGLYRALELPMYDPDTPQKWAKVDQTLQDTSYIIIASNRLYMPLQRLTDCSGLPPGRCYPQTAEYYRKLFNGQLGFTKIAEFTDYPHLSFPIYDDSADESFTVYDHPKIMIFKKSSRVQ